MKHTPGPWTLAHNWRGKMAICGPEFTHDLRIDRICNVPYRADQQGPANAHLITAAPEMYAFLKELPWAQLTPQQADRVALILAKVEGRRS